MIRGDEEGPRKMGRQNAEEGDRSADRSHRAAQDRGNHDARATDAPHSNSDATNTLQRSDTSRPKLCSEGNLLCLIQCRHCASRYQLFGVRIELL